MNPVTEIHSIDAPELAFYANLSEKQLYHYFEPAPGIFLAESPNVIERALAAGYEPLSVLACRKQMTGRAAEILSGYGNLPVYTAPDSVLGQIGGFQLTRGMQCAMRRKTLPAVETVLDGATRVVVLENVMNPTNVGAIFRSAAALNIDAVLLTTGCADPLQKRAVRVSVGNVFLIPWTYFPGKMVQEGPQGSSACHISSLKALGFTTVAMALKENSVSIRDPRLKSAEKLAIVMGTEGEGLRQATIDACDYTVKIPMSNGVDSLNVAAAGAVAFWELGNHRELPS